MSTKEKEIDNIFTFLELSTLSKFNDKVNKYLSLSEITSLKEIDPALTNGFMEDDKTFCSTHNNPMDVNNKYDVSFIRTASSIDSDGDFIEKKFGKLGEVKYSIFRARPISAKVLRGKAKRIYPIMSEVTNYWIHENGQYIGTKWYFGRVANNWALIDLDRVKMNEYTDEDLYKHNVMISAAIERQFDRHYNWRVSLGYGNGATVSFESSPEGSKELFKLRDAPEGKSRRAALKNWVSEHWRKSKYDRDASIRVREHLRGQTEFTWNNYKVKIIPAPADLESLK